MEQTAPEDEGKKEDGEKCQACGKPL